MWTGSGLENRPILSAFKFTCGVFIYLDLGLNENIITLLAPDADHTNFIHFFEFWAVVDRTIVLIVNTIMVVGVLSQKGVLMWPFLFWAPLQVSENGQMSQWNLILLLRIIIRMYRL